MIKPFGELADGRVVHAITLGAPDRLQAQVLTYGGILRELLFVSRGVRHSLVVSLPDLDAYVRDTAFVGTLVGRVANRIDHARFELNGREHQLVANEGVHHLHGGRLGFGKRLWEIVDHEGANRVRLGLHSSAGEEGYPGNLDVTAEYVIEGSELSVHFEAKADADTPFSPTFHPYFNVTPDAQLLIQANGYLPLRPAELIPIGEIYPVAGTPFDFRMFRRVEVENGYDHCWVLNEPRNYDAKLRLSTGIELTICSDRAGLQFYGGQYTPAFSAICLEPQGLPNAVNVPAFPAIILKSGTLLNTTFRYQLTD